MAHDPEGWRSQAAVFKSRHCFWLLLLSLLLYSIPSHAATAIESGQIVTGHITGAPSPSTDSYTIDVPAGAAMLVSVSEVGPDTSFWPYIKTFKPNGFNGGTAANHFYAKLSLLSVAGGTWTIDVTRFDGTANGGDYSLTVVVVPADTSVSGGGAGGAMYAQKDYTGTIYRGQLNVYTFNGLSGGSPSYTPVTISATGGRGFTPWIQVYSATGANEGQTWTSSTAHLNFAGIVTGDTYTIVVSKHDQNDVVGSYTLNVGKASLPTQANADGSFCLACALGGAHAGDPINVATGNLYESYTDYTTAGANPLAFKRYYNSMSYMRNLYPTMMGINWRSNYDRYLRILSTSQAVAERPDGQVINFTSSGSWAPVDADMDYRLSESGTTWKLTDHNDTVESYTESSGKGRLDSITLRNGYEQDLNYSSAGLLTSVSDTYGRELDMTYSSAGLLTGVDTPDNLSLSYGYISYSSSGLLDTVTYNTSPSTSQTYLYGNTELPYALTGITDEDGNRYATWAYDGAGRATSAEHAHGADLTQITYSSSGDYTVTGPLGIADTYHFTTAENKPKVTQIDRAANGSVGAATAYMTYDSNGFLSTMTDWNGNQTSWTNDSHGDPTEIVFASGSGVAKTVDITYDTTWPRLPSEITSPGVTEDLSYDSSGNLTSRELTDTTTQSVPYSTNGQTRTWQYTYTSSGLLASAQLPRTDVTAKTTYGYTNGVLTSITDAAGHETQVTSYQTGGLPLIVKDPNGVETHFAYNNRNWLTSSIVYTSAGNYETDLTYDSAGNLTKETLPDSSSLSYGYDDAHRLTSITNALSEEQDITYDSAGNLTQRLWKNASGTTKREYDATYDALGRRVTSEGGEGQTTDYTYDDNGNVLTITDPLDNETTQTWDALNRLSTTTDALGDETDFTYSSAGNLASVNDPLGHETDYVYDGFGERIQTASPDSGTTVWHYDKDYNVSEKLDANNYETDLSYDDLDRTTARHYPADSALNVDYTYDQSGHGSGVGRLTSLTDAAGSLSLSWGQRGHLTGETRTISGTDYETDFSYESAGRLSSITYASAGWLVSYGRDDAGQVSSITATQPGHSAVNVATSITHLPFGPVSGFTFGNGATDTRTFDNDYRMTAIHDAGASDIYYTSAGYDADNNVTSITDHVTSTNDQDLEYDSAGRLSFASSGSYTGGDITYDSNANRLSYGSTTYTIASGSNRMTNDGSHSISYSSAGNITAIGSDSFSYNKANQLSSATVSGTTSDYTYGAFGQRLKSVAGGTTTLQLYGQNGQLLSEFVPGTSETNYAYLDGFPVAAIDTTGANIYALHTDRLGTPWKATNSSKSVVWSGAYAPFGTVSPTGSITQNLRFPGQYADPTGFYHNGFRDYAPAYGRYLESDLIGLKGGLNTYNYARQNPLKYTDPSGLCIGPLFAVCFELGVEAVEVAPEALEALSIGSREVLAALSGGEAASAAGTVAAGVAPEVLPPEPPNPAVQGGQCIAANPLENANFSQKTFSQTFSPNGTFAGQTVEDLAAALRNGTLSPADVPVQYINREGNILILNTRSAQALEQAGIPRSQRNAIEMTGDPSAENRLTNQLSNSGLTNAGTPTTRLRGQ